MGPGYLDKKTLGPGHLDKGTLGPGHLKKEKCWSWALNTRRNVTLGIWTKRHWAPDVRISQKLGLGHLECPEYFDIEALCPGHLDK